MNSYISNGFATKDEVPQNLEPSNRIWHIFQEWHFSSVVNTQHLAGLCQISRIQENCVELTFWTHDREDAVPTKLYFRFFFIIMFSRTHVQLILCCLRLFIRSHFFSGHKIVLLYLHWIYKIRNLVVIETNGDLTWIKT